MENNLIILFSTGACLREADLTKTEERVGMKGNG
jgi:hypothetical protein